MPWKYSLGLKLASLCFLQIHTLCDSAILRACINKRCVKRWHSYNNFKTMLWEFEFEKKIVANEGQMLQQVWLYENQMQTKRCTYNVLGVNIATIHRKKVCIICEIYRHFGLKLPYSKAGSWSYYTRCHTGPVFALSCAKISVLLIWYLQILTMAMLIGF